jgi:DNA-3-methyladenine glycosylase
MTPRNRSLFLCREHAYVYVAYEKFCMLNVVSEIAGVGAAILIRAIRQRNRRAQSLCHLTRGPGRLTVALEIDRRLDGTDLCRKGHLWLACDDQNPWEIGRSAQIGLSRGVEHSRRLFIRGDRFVSGPNTLDR